jgi:cyclin H
MCDPAQSTQVKCWLLKPDNLDICRARANRMARRYIVSQQKLSSSSSMSSTKTGDGAVVPIIQSFAKNFGDNKEKFMKEDQNDDGPWETDQTAADDENDKSGGRGHPFLTPDEEQLLVTFYAAKIPNLIGPIAQLEHLRRRESKFPATAAMLFRRFYLSNSVLIHDPKVMMVSAAWLASKVEDLMVPVRHLEQATNEMNSPVTRSEIIPSEVHLLAGVDFDLLCFHPYKAVVAMTEDMRNHLKTPEAQRLVTFPDGSNPDRIISGKDLDPMYRTAVAIVNDAVISDLPLIYTPSQIGLAAILLSTSTDENTGGNEPDLTPRIDFMGYLHYRFGDKDTKNLQKLLQDICDKLKGLKEGKYGCGNYNVDMQKLKEIHKKLKKCRIWGTKLSSSSSKKEKKKKKNDGKVEDGGPPPKKAKTAS